MPHHDVIKTAEAVAAADESVRVTLSCGPGVALEPDTDQGQTLGADLAVAARWAEFAPDDDPTGDTGTTLAGVP